MKRTIDWLKAIALIAFSLVCLGVGSAALQTAKLLESVDRTLPVIAASVNGTAEGLSGEVPKLQASVQSIANSLQDTASATRSTVLTLRAELPPIAAQVTDDLQETHRLILESALTASEARKASADERAALPAITAKANQSLDDLAGELSTLQATTRDLDKLVNDPANAQTLKSLSDGSAAMAATAKDGQQFVHSLLHPTWPHKVWNVTLDVAHVFNPL